MKPKRLQVLTSSLFRSKDLRLSPSKYVKTTGLKTDSSSAQFTINCFHLSISAGFLRSVVVLRRSQRLVRFQVLKLFPAEEPEITDYRSVLVDHLC